MTQALQWFSRLRIAIIAILSLTATAQAAAATQCQANPLGARDLYLRGSFNSWSAEEARKFTYFCDRFELVTQLLGEHSFKLADEDWSAQADFGSDVVVLNRPTPLQLRGKAMKQAFDGHYKFVMNTPTLSPSLTVTQCAAPPLGEKTLFLRGSMNNWAALDEYAFQWSCDAYYLNVDLNGTFNFKLADAAWSPALTFGSAPGGRNIPAVDHPLGMTQGSAPGGAADITFQFSGAQTLKLAFDGGATSLTVGALSFANPKAQAVKDPIALSLRFDSRALAHKTPFGAVTSGSEVRFTVDALPGVEKLTLVLETRRLSGNQEVLEYQPLTRLDMQRSSPGKLDRFTAAYQFDGIAVYGYWFEATIGGKSYVYQNNAVPVHWTREKGAGGLGDVAEKPARLQDIRRWRLSVYDPKFQVPAWAPDTVYYYIFPDRFRNGNKSLDPKPGSRRYQNHDIEFHTNWTDKPYKPGSGDGSDSVYNNDFFGGDIDGIIEKLDYIADLGANALYITPMFLAASNHKYDTADYKNIDPAFGSNEDFTRLTREAAKRGIRVVPDASLNHTGSDSVYFDRYGNYHSHGAFEGGRIHPESPYASWYRLDPTQTEPSKQYTGWVGVADLPELNKDAPAWRDYAYRAQDSVTRLWLERGASGWRMDVAPWVPDDFWREWRAVVKQTKPDAITIAETWFDASKHLLGDMFDSTMNYIFRNAVLDFANGGSAQALVSNLELLRESYPPPAFSALMNLLSSHDQARSLYVLGYRDVNTSRREITLAKQKFLLAVFFQMTYPGSPAVYYGDEVGVTGGDDPYNRGTYPWQDIGGMPDLDMLNEFKRLIRLRNEHPVLRRGSLRAPLWTDEHSVVLLRQWQKQWAVTAFNNSAVARTVAVNIPEPLEKAVFTNALTGEKVATRGGNLIVQMPAMSGCVLLAP